MDALFSILGLLGLILYGICWKTFGDKPKWYQVLLLIFATGAVIVFYSLSGFFVEKSKPSPIHTKKFTHKTEIRQEYVNGNLTSTDTIYYFTPKKK